MRSYGPHPVPPLRDRPLEALRAVAANPGGLRVEAHRTVMPMLAAMGLVRMRARGAPAWVLTPLGQRAITAYGRDET